MQMGMGSTALLLSDLLVLSEFVSTFARNIFGVGVDFGHAESHGHAT
jgi:hypothetical protein